jgi:hypothetical protein
MNKNIFVHIGYPRTGTTWFQRVFFTLHEDIFYLDEPNNRWLNDFVWKSDFEFNSDEMKEKFVDSVKGSQKQIIGISNEGFCGNILGRLIEPRIIADRLRRVFGDYDVKLIVFLRNQAEILLSIYKVLIKEGTPCRYESLFDPSAIYRINLSYFKYDKMIELWQQYFEKNSIGVFLYEDFIKNKLEFLNLLCNFLSISSVSPDSNKVLHNKLDFIINPGYPDSSIPLIRIFNKLSTSYMNPDGLLPKKMSKRLRKMTKKRWFFKIFSLVKGNYSSRFREANDEYFCNYFDRSNKNLEKLLKKDLKDHYPMVV